MTEEQKAALRKLDRLIGQLIILAGGSLTGEGREKLFSITGAIDEAMTPLLKALDEPGAP